MKSDPKSRRPGTELSQVIVIEDEVLMRALLEKHLRSIIEEGHTEAFSFSSLSSGWDLLTADLSQVKVAVVDLLLPQITGVDLIRDFRQRYPQLGIVPISGMATQPMKRALQETLPEGFELVPKPLRKETFSQAFLKAWIFQKQPQSPVPVPTEEAVKDMWSVGNTNTTNTQIVHRKLLRKKTVA